MATTQAERLAEFRKRRDAELRALRGERYRTGDSFAKACFAVAQGRALQREVGDLLRTTPWPVTSSPARP